MHFVDLGESFPTQIDLQSVTSIQPRTTPSKLESKIVGLAPTQVLRNAGAFPRVSAASAAASVSAAFAEAAFRPHPVTAASYAAAGGAHESLSAPENSQKFGPTDSTLFRKTTFRNI